MSLQVAPQVANSSSRTMRPTYRPGDFVTTVTGYPVLYEVLTIERDSMVRVRGVNWAPGYSAVVATHEIRPVTHILTP
jgi:hypothetical protein